MGFLFKLSLLIFILAIITFGFNYYLKTSSNYQDSLKKTEFLSNHQNNTRNQIDKEKDTYLEKNNSSLKQSLFFDKNEIRVLTPIEEKKRKTTSEEKAEENTTTNQNNEELKPIEITIEAKEFKFEPNIFTVKENQQIKLIVKNSGNIPHNLRIEKENIIFQTSLIAPGEENILEFKAPPKGEYDFYCTLGDHKIRGMFGKMIVE